MTTKTKRKTRTPYEALEQRSTVLEAALEAIKGEQAAALVRELDTIPVSTSAPAIPEPVIPLGYERCDFEQADREDKNNNRVLLLLYSFGGTTWDEAAFCWPNAEAHKAGREIYLRCVLPPEIASHWRPAPGRTHKEQRNSAWPMGRSDHKDWFAAWAPARGTMVTKIETTTFMVSDTFIPLVPKKKP